MDTIVALSSGALPAGVAVVRISGRDALDIARRASVSVHALDRKMRLVDVIDPETREVIDKGLACVFVAPRSFTGEDCVEFHLHGGRAVVNRFLDVLTAFDDVRLAEPGEFTKRAFINGKIDLTSAEGLADLIEAQTEAQRRLANKISNGDLAKRYRSWRDELLRYRAMLEADIDFADEDDVPGSVAADVHAALQAFVGKLAGYLDQVDRADSIRDGFKVAIVGEPNSGKSTLLNALAGREAAIVSAIPGTTRDIVEVQLQLGGFLVRVIDTAGIRDTDDVIEQEGVRRAKMAMSEANLVISLSPNGDWLELEDVEVPTVHVLTKSDLEGDGEHSACTVSVSAKTGAGMNRLLSSLTERVAGTLGATVEEAAGNQRHARKIAFALNQLSEITAAAPTEITAERLRLAGQALSELTGEVGTEDVLGEIFSSFCIGK